ncbi:Ubiquitin-conjugating enzyme E2 T [Mortierella sp. NVP41]|nr:Ubiquitin-conjugating enzyme E2 T [Mortierella sp. NVP41]
MAAVDKRILLRMRKELGDLEVSPPLGVVCYPVNDSIVHLQAEITGPEDTPYHGGSFKIDIHIPDKYPFEPPRCQFLTRVYHPNIDEQGLICLDILKSQPKGAWGPAISITTMLMSLRLLLAQPNPDDPLLVDVASEFKENRELFIHKAKEFTKQYATGSQETTVAASEANAETRIVGLKELESVSEGSSISSAFSLSRSSSSTLLVPTPAITTALPLKTGPSGTSTITTTATSASTANSSTTERISLARPTHKKLTLSRRPTASVVTSAVSALSAPFVPPRPKSSADLIPFVGQRRNSLGTRGRTPEKQMDITSPTHSTKAEHVAEPAHTPLSKSPSQEASYPSLQDTIAVNNQPPSQDVASYTDTTISLDTTGGRTDKKRGVEAMTSEEPTTETKTKTKRAKGDKKLTVRSKPFKRFSSPIKESSESFPAAPSSLSTLVESTSPESTLAPAAPKLSLTLPTTLKSPVSTTTALDPPDAPVDADQSTPRRPSVDSTVMSPQPGSQEPSDVKRSKTTKATPMLTTLKWSSSTLLTSVTSTKSTLGKAKANKKVPPPQKTVDVPQEVEPQPPTSDTPHPSGILDPSDTPDTTQTSDQLPPVSPFSKDKGKSKAVDDIRMDAKPRETDENESLSFLNRMEAKRQDNPFSFMDDMSSAPNGTTTTAFGTGQRSPLTVARKRNLLKKHRP